MIHFDMSPQAYNLSGTIAAGVELMTWKLVSCDVTGNIGLFFAAGSSQ